MLINGISYWMKDGKCEMLNLDEGLKILRFPDEDEESDANGCTVAKYKKRYLEHVKADPDYNWSDGVHKIR